jgi:hypothetical protein
VKLCFKGYFFQNGCRCHGKCQNAKKVEKHKNDHSWLLTEQKLMKLDKNKIHIWWNEISQQIGIFFTNFAAVAMEKKDGIKNYFRFLSSNFMTLCGNIHRSVWQLIRG